MTHYPGPSPAQEETLRYIWRWSQEHQFQPSYREMAKAFGGISTQAVQDRLRGLDKKGYLQMSGRARGLRITDKGRQYMENQHESETV